VQKRLRNRNPHTNEETYVHTRVLRRLRVPTFPWEIWDRKLFGRVTERCLNGCENYMSKKSNAAESLQYKGVATFSSGDETTDWSFWQSVISYDVQIYFLHDAN